MPGPAGPAYGTSPNHGTIPALRALCNALHVVAAPPHAARLRLFAHHLDGSTRVPFCSFFQKYFFEEVILAKKMAGKDYESRIFFKKQKLFLSVSAGASGIGTAGRYQRPLFRPGCALPGGRRAAGCGSWRACELPLRVFEQATGKGMACDSARLP